MEKVFAKIILLTVLFSILALGVLEKANLGVEWKSVDKEPLQKLSVAPNFTVNKEERAEEVSVEDLYYLALSIFGSVEASERYNLGKNRIYQRRSATPIILEIREKWNTLSAGLKKKLEFIFARPTDSGGDWPDYTQHILPQLYNTTHFVLHWTNGSDGGDPIDAVPLNDTDMNGYPDYVENFADIFEYVWDMEVNIFGFSAPPSDEERPNDAYNGNPDSRYDVFIFDMNYYGFADPEQWGNSTFSYIGVENDYEGFSLGQLEAMQVTAAHEFFHAIQFGYDSHEERWWMETTATYMEDEVFPDINANYRYLPSWFLWPDRGLENTSGLHEYGNFIFAKFLSENFGDVIIKEIWEKMSEPNMDGLIAINYTLSSKNSTLTEVFSAFITANFFLEEMYEDGLDYRETLSNASFKGVWIEYQYDASTAQNSTEINATNVNWDAWMDKWATDYITLKLDPEVPKYKILFDGLDSNTNYLVKLATKKEGTIDERVFQLNEQKDGYLILTYDEFENVTLIIANAGNTTTSNPSWRVIIDFFEASAALLQVLPELTLEQLYTNFTINVTIENIFDLWAIEIELQWNKTILECADAMPVLLWANTSILYDELNGTAGNYRLKMEGLEPSAPFNGNATVAAFQFYATEIGKSFLQLTNISLIDTAGQAIPYQAKTGYFETLSHDVAIINLSVSKTVVKRGELLAINVTIENQGNFTEFFNVTFYGDAMVLGKREVTLDPGDVTVLTFLWDTSGYSTGDYIVKATIERLPNEVDIKDNDSTGNTVIITTFTSRPISGGSGGIRRVAFCFM
jgi:hypothetical protein